jgi:hypothetical protein
MQDTQEIQGRWVTARAYSELTGISSQTLSNWRSDDSKRGYIRPGRPLWKRFGGGLIRYWVGPDFLPQRDLVNMAPASPRGPRAKRQHQEGA